MLPILISAAFHFNGLYGQDAYAYLEMTFQLHHTSILESSKSFFWPMIYPLSGFALSPLMFSDLMGLRAVSILSFALSAILLERIIRLLYQIPTANPFTYTFLFFILSPFVFRFSTLVMSDMLCMFLVLSCTYFVLKGLKTVNVALAVVAGVLAISTRYASIFLVAVPLLFLATQLLKKRKIVQLMAMGLFALIASIPHFYFKGINPGGLFSHKHLLNWSPINYFSSSFSNAMSLNERFSHSNLLSLILDIVSPAYCFAFLPMLIALIVFRKQINFNGKFIWLMPLIYLAFIAGIPFQNKRFILLAFPFILLMFYPVYNVIIEKTERVKLIFGLTVGVQIILIALALRNPIQLSNHEKMLCEKVTAITSSVIPVYTSGLEGPLRYNLPDYTINGLFLKTVDFPDRFNLIVDSSQIARQNQDLVLVRNFNKAFSEYLILNQTQLSQNWTLYEFER